MARSPPLVAAARVGLLGPLGTGAQWWPWIHLDDEITAILHCLEHPELRGPVNLVSPAPVRQRDLARAVASRLRRPTVARLPAALVRLVLGEAASFVLDGQRVLPTALRSSGFSHRFESLAAALDDLVDPPRRGAAPGGTATERS